MGRIKSLIFITICGGMSMAVFLKGYLQMRATNYKTANGSFPIEDNWNNVQGNSHLSPVFNKCIIVIIDALRFDYFIPWDISLYKRQLKHISQTFNEFNGHSLVFKFIADPPTTTMQRLRGLTIGSIPTFLEIKDSFSSNYINEDNILNQLFIKKKKIVFLGDDTWQQLFPPKMFYKMIPFPSFVVKDLHTVDDGIIQNIYPILNSSKWDVIISHFLGVDHCGHWLGINHPEMGKKLQQMDTFFKNVTRIMDNDTLLLVFGDHGSTSSGDHGGESKSEVESILFAYSKQPLFKNQSYDDEILSVSQIDLVPTLSMLLGIPIPYSSIGRIIPPFFGDHKSNFDYSIKLSLILRINMLQVDQIMKFHNFDNKFNEKSNISMAKIRMNLNKKFEELRSMLVLHKSEMFHNYNTQNLKRQDILESASQYNEMVLTYLTTIQKSARKEWIEYDYFNLILGLLFLATTTILYAYHIVTTSSTISQSFDAVKTFPNSICRSLISYLFKFVITILLTSQLIVILYSSKLSTYILSLDLLLYLAYVFFLTLSLREMATGPRSDLSILVPPPVLYDRASQHLTNHDEASRVRHSGIRKRLPANDTNLVPIRRRAPPPDVSKPSWDIILFITFMYLSSNLSLLSNSFIISELTTTKFLLQTVVGLHFWITIKSLLRSHGAGNKGADGTVSFTKICLFAIPYILFMAFVRLLIGQGKEGWHSSFIFHPQPRSDEGDTFRLEQSFGPDHFLSGGITIPSHGDTGVNGSLNAIIGAFGSQRDDLVSIFYYRLAGFVSKTLISCSLVPFVVYTLFRKLITREVSVCQKTANLTFHLLPFIAKLSYVCLVSYWASLACHMLYLTLAAVVNDPTFIRPSSGPVLSLSLDLFSFGTNGGDMRNLVEYVATRVILISSLVGVTYKPGRPKFLKFLATGRGSTGSENVEHATERPMAKWVLSLYRCQVTIPALFLVSREGYVPHYVCLLLLATLWIITHSRNRERHLDGDTNLKNIGTPTDEESREARLLGPDVPTLILNVATWYLLGQFGFFLLGHQHEISAIKWDSAFEGVVAHGTPGSTKKIGINIWNYLNYLNRGEPNRIVSGYMIFLNTFCSQVTCILSLPILVLSPHYLRSSHFKNGRSKLSTVTVADVGRDTHLLATIHLSYLIYLFLTFSKMLICTIGVFIHRRHLMLWAIFFPRFIYATTEFFLASLLIIIIS